MYIVPYIYWALFQAWRLQKGTNYCSFSQGGESLLEVDYTHMYDTKNNAEREALTGVCAIGGVGKIFGVSQIIQVGWWWLEGPEAGNLGQ